MNQIFKLQDCFAKELLPQNSSAFSFVFQHTWYNIVDVNVGIVYKKICQTFVKYYGFGYNRSKWCYFFIFKNKVHNNILVLLVFMSTHPLTVSHL